MRCWANGCVSLLTPFDLVLWDAAALEASAISSSADPDASLLCAIDTNDTVYIGGREVDQTFPPSPGPPLSPPTYLGDAVATTTVHDGTVLRRRARPGEPFVAMVPIGAHADAGAGAGAGAGGTTGADAGGGVGVAGGGLELLVGTRTEGHILIVPKGGDGGAPREAVDAAARWQAPADEVTARWQAPLVALDVSPSLSSSTPSPRPPSSSSRPPLHLTVCGLTLAGVELWSLARGSTADADPWSMELLCVQSLACDGAMPSRPPVQAVCSGGVLWLRGAVRGGPTSSDEAAAMDALVVGGQGGGGRPAKPRRPRPTSHPPASIPWTTRLTWAAQEGRWWA